jgi:hypothetical protein
LRTKENYLEKRDEIIANPSLRSEYGILKDHPFMDLENFDVTQCSPPDLMHDIIEGVVLKTLNLILEDILNTIEKVKDFNQAIRKIKWPSGRIRDLIINKVKVGGTASQISFLYINLPLFLFKTFITHENTWKLYGLLRDITCILFSESIDRKPLNELRENIKLFFSYFKKVFSESTFTPKFHYMSHYPDLILKFGPLLRFNTMRFERKHLYFKLVSNRSKNYINPTKTLSFRHQRLLSIFSESYFSKKKVFYGKTFEINLNSTPKQHLTAVPELLDSRNSRTNKVIINDIELIKGFYYCVDLSEELGPIFVKIEEIYLVNDYPIIMSKKYSTKYFERKFYSYCIVDTRETMFLKPENLVSYKKFKSFEHENVLFIQKTVIFCQ